MRTAVLLLALAFAATPAYVVRFHAGPLPTTALEVVLLLGIVAGGVALRGRLVWSGLWRSPYAWPGLLLLLGATVGVAVSPDRAGALGEWRAFFVEPVAAGLVAAGLVRRDRGAARWLLLGLAVSGGFAALVNLFHVIPLQLEHRVNVTSPPVAIYQNANQEALYLVPLDAVALAFVLFARDRAERWVAGAFLVLTVPAVLLSYSRDGIAALAVAAVVVALFHPRRWAIVLPLLAVLAAAVAALPGIRRRVEVELDPGSPDNTLHARLGLWQGTLRMLEHRPLFGAGLRGFDQDVEPYYHDPFRVAFPHDVALNFWSETGLLGLAGFVWLSAAAMVSAVRTRALPLSVGVAGFIVAVWVHGAVDVPYLKNDLAVAFWAVLGLHAGLIEAA